MRTPIMSTMNLASFSTLSARAANAPRQSLSRNAIIAVAVVGLHVGLIWALQTGLLMRTAELIVPAEVLAQFIDPPAPVVEPVPVPPQPPAPAEPKKAVAKPPARPQPQPLAVADPLPSPDSSKAPAGVVTPTVQAAPIAVAPAAPAAPPAPPSPPAVQLPSSDADYLQNARPPYPPMSKRLNEQGKTTVRVLIGVDGSPQRADIVQSSGFERLDQAAVTTVMRWRYVPGKRGGVAEAMWFNVPINWVLE